MQQLQRLPVSWILALHLLTFIFSFCLATPVFHRGDDFGMISVLAGFYGPNESHLFFCHFLTGKFLSFLYASLPGFPWYEWTMSALLVFSYLMLIYLMHKKLGVMHSKLPALLFLFGPGLFMALNIHFSFASAFPAMVSFLMMESAILTSGKKHALFYGGSILSGVLSLLARTEIFLLAWVLFLPLFAVKCLNAGISGRNIVRYGKGFFLLLAIGLIFHFTHFGPQGANGEYRKFTGFFKDRARFTDYVIPYEERAAREAGWSKNDYDLIVNWFYADSSVFSGEALKKYILNSENPLARKIKKNLNLGSGLSTKVLSEFQHAGLLSLGTHPFIKFLLNSLLHFKVWFIFLACCFFLHWRYGSKQEALFVISYAGLVFLLISFFLKPPPPRILLTLLAFQSMVHLFLIKEEILQKGKFKKTSVIFGYLALLYFAWFQWQGYQYRESTKGKALRYLSFFEEIKEITEGSVMINWGPGFSISSMAMPFKTSEYEKMKRFPFIHLGSFYGSPFQLAHMHSLGIRSLPEAILENKKLIWISTPDLMSKLQKFLVEHHSHFTTVICVEKRIGAYQLIPTKPR